METVQQLKEKNIRKYQTVVYHHAGKSYTDIEGLVGVNRGTISKWLNKFKKTGSVEKDLYETCGRPIKLTQSKQDLIIQELRNDNRTTQIHLSEALQKEAKTLISTSTISRFESIIGKFKLMKTNPS